MTDLLNAASGHWPEILTSLVGISSDQLTDQHQPCPLCGGTDRYRFDDLEGSGSWFCNQCGGKDQRGGAGNGMDLLLRATGWSFADAAKRVEQYLGISSDAPAKRRGKPHRIPDKPPADASPPALGRATAQWCYRDADGQQLFWIQRLDLPAQNGKAARKIFVHRVWLDGRWHYPRNRGENADAFTCEWPAPRPLYRLPDLVGRPDAPVLVVEGEKASDRAAELFPQTVVVSWSNGANADALINWTPLQGRRVTLWPDNDQDGRAAMARVAQRLQTLGCTIKAINPPKDFPKGWDVADATDWDTEVATTFVRDHIQVVEHAHTIFGSEAEPRDSSPPPSHAESAPSEPEPITSARGGYFTALGFDADGYYYQPQGTGQVVRLSRSSHTGTNLVALAPLCYWESTYYGKSGPNWVAAASDLFQQQAAVGVYAPDRIRGRGAWWDREQSVLHLGDRLVVDGHERPVTSRIPNSPYLYQRLSSLQGPAGVDPLSDADAYILAELAERFHWEVPASGLLLAGWVTLAPICGALPWRPHAWLTAAAGSGKSAILDRYVTPLLGDLGLIVSGNTTEPGIRQALRADARPVVFDEAESNERADQLRMQAILGLARVASSESKAHTLKGTPEGDTQRFMIRSMFLMSSIATSLKQGADKSRFAQLTLRNPTELPKVERIQHWEALDRDLDRHISDEIGRRLQARTIRLIPTIRASIRVFTRVAAERFDSQRLGDQYGTLLAGAWSLQSSEIATDQQAMALIDQNNWEPYSQATEIPDERRCIQRILQHQVRVEADKVITRSIGELVEIALHRQHDIHITPDLAHATLGRNGIRAESDTVIISNNAEAIAAILRDTSWSNCWSTVLTRLPGATRAGVTYFRGAGASGRAVKVPLDAVDFAD